MQTGAATIDIPSHGNCANCGSVLTGHFCAQCGQSVEAIKRPAWELIEHALEAFFHFDMRGFKSSLLLFVPGEMTAQYLAGRRARFVPPVRFYILISLVFFLAIWVTDTAMIQFYNVPVQTGAAPGMPGLGMRLLAPLDPTLKADPGSVQGDIEIVDDKGEVPGWFATLSQGLAHGVANPHILNERLSELFPKVMFALVPLFGLLSRLLYLRRGYYLIEHLIFALYFHCFAFILASLLILLRPILPAGWVVWLFFLPTAAYLLVALRRVFGGGWFGTAIREIFLLILYAVAFAAGMLFLVGKSLSEI